MDCVSAAVVTSGPIHSRRTGGTLYKHIKNSQVAGLCNAPSEIYSCRQPIASFYVNGISYCMKLMPMIVTMWAAWYYGLSLSDYIAYCAVLMLVNEAMMQLQNITKDGARLLLEIRLCQPIMAAMPEFKDNRQVVKSITGQMEIRGLKFRYAENMPLLFDGLNLTINSGDYVALVGGSGCGKSTLMRLMLGLEHPLAGSVFYDQYDLSGINLRSLRPCYRNCRIN